MIYIILKKKNNIYDEESFTLLHTPLPHNSWAIF